MKEKQKTFCFSLEIEANFAFCDGLQTDGISSFLTGTQPWKRNDSVIEKCVNRGVMGTSY